MVFSAIEYLNRHITYWVIVGLISLHHVFFEGTIHTMTIIDATLFYHDVQDGLFFSEKVEAAIYKKGL